MYMRCSKQTIYSGKRKNETVREKLSDQKLRMRPTSWRIPQFRLLVNNKLSTNATSPPRPVDHSGGMDVGAWSWQWRAAGGVAVALFTPWCGLKLLQINIEVRENVESLLPSFVNWVRENYGFDDEDKERRRHVAYIDNLYNQPHQFVVQGSTMGRKCDEVVSGSVCGTSSAEDVARMCPGMSASTVSTSNIVFLDQADVCEELDVAEQPQRTCDNSLLPILNQVSSLWEVGTSQESLSVVDSLVLDIVSIKPIGSSTGRGARSK
jgi:hypothetical protein